MSDRHDSSGAAAQTSSGMFKRFPKGASLATMNLKHDLDIVYDILEFLRGENGIIVRKTDPRAYIVDGADVGDGGSGGGMDLEGWEEETLYVVTTSGIVKRTVMVKTATKSTTRAFSGSDNRMLLQIDSDGKLTIDKGYLVS